MPAFQRPFNPQTVSIAEGQLTLPDRYGIVPPGTRFARYSGSLLHVLIATPAGANTSFNFSWPATGVSRVVDLEPQDAATLGFAEASELSLLPFAISAVLRNLLPGLPTFYVGLAGAPLPPQDEIVRTTDAPLSVNRAVIGAIFQDGVTLEPWAWVDLIGNALPAEDAAAWRSLAALWNGRRTLRVLNAAGQPPAQSETFTIRHVDANGNPTSTTTVQSTATGDLGSAFPPPAGQRTEIIWQPPNPPPGGSLPVMALYEPSIAAPDDDTTRAIPPGSPVTLTLPAGFSGGHLQILDLAKWFSDIVPTPGRAWPARFRSHSKLEPLIDGPPVFRRLLAEMQIADGVHLGGWAFREFPLDPDDPDSTLLKLIARDRQKYRLLVAQFFRPKVGALTGAATRGELAIIFFAALAIANPLIAIDAFDRESDIKGVLAFQGVVALAYAAMILTDLGQGLESWLREKSEKTEEEVRADVYKTPVIGYPSRHLVRLADNPLSEDLTLPDGRTLSDLQDCFSVHHTKMQVMSMPGQTPAYIGYVGGTDINSNRINSPGHNGAGFRKPDSTDPPSPATFHDVHARITGPAAYDVAGIYQDRYLFEVNMGDDGNVQDPLFDINAPRLPPVFTLPDTPEDVAPAGHHLVQVARTTFAPAAGSTGYPWSPGGEAPIRFTFERAIAEAREYIYIEDQYLTPDNGFVAALRNAADRCRRLVILIPASADQPFGDQRRLAIVERLSGATGGPGGWGDRMIVGTPFRRPVLSPAQRKVSHGRMTLVRDVSSAAAPEIFAGPPTRVPTATPYFFWVGGELMCAVKTQKVTTPEGQEAVRIEVLRGGLGTQSRWCPHPRQHAAGTPITVAEPKAIFVHSKIMIVDDVFAGIGSANYNRRGFFHDGEVTAFAIPDRLRASADNPARQLRTELWAEHLGLTPFMGRALLGDPVAAFEFFRRSRYGGNRVTPFHEFRIPPAELSSLASHPLLALIPLSLRVTLLATLQAGLMTQIPDLWNTLSDPTSGADPNATPGPDLP